MATRIAWLLNLDAEVELQDPARYRVSRGGPRASRSAELEARMADLIAPDDVVLDDVSAMREVVQPLHQGAWTILAFCPTPSALARIAALGLPVPPAPSLAVLRAMSDRSFCASLGHGLPQSCFVRDLRTLEAYLEQRSPTGSHVIKRAFSFAGREQRRVRDGVLDDSTRGFCTRSFDRGEGVQVEPWVQRLRDFSRHGYLTRTGSLCLGASREQRCDPMGRFVGMSPGPAEVSEAEDAALATELIRSADAMRAAGYFGPFGIDGFRYRKPDGSVAFNPRCEINARFTMGYPRALLLDGLAADAEAPM
jgi:hypothetical protein